MNRVQHAARDRKLKIGHAGTLDPMATGVLLIVVGEATRLVEQLHELSKSYSAVFEFGRSSDTLDREGIITVHQDVVRPTVDDIKQACAQWTGEVMQQPPRFSAIKIKGQRAYDLARNGAEFEPETRPVRIDRLTLTAYDYPTWKLDIQCGSGTYVRSIGRDVAQAVGNVAIMTDLVRTAIGPFAIEEACPLDLLNSVSSIEERLRSPLEGLPQWRQVQLDASQVVALRHGQLVQLSSKQWSHGLPSSDRWVAVDDGRQLIALIELSPRGQARPVRVFKTTMATSQPRITSTRHNPES